MRDRAGDPGFGPGAGKGGGGKGVAAIALYRAPAAKREPAAGKSKLNPRQTWNPFQNISQRFPKVA